MFLTISQAHKILREGGVIGLPTETVYGLAASIDSAQGIQKVFELKNRPPQNPLIVHVDSISQAEELVTEFPEGARRLAEIYWPGSLTLVLPAKSTVSTVIRANLPTVAIRCPAHPLAKELLKVTGPLIAPSANLSSRPSSTEPLHIQQDFGADFPILDGGKCEKGIESTILVWDHGRWKLGRLGAIPLSELERHLSQPIEERNKDAITSPGQFFRHYSPKGKVHLLVEAQETYPPIILGYRDRTYPGASYFIDLGLSTDPKSIAYHLYEALRKVDENQFQEAWIDYNLPQSIEFQAVKERLMKAAH